MATRRRCHRATRSRPTFKSKWLNLQGLGGKRDPLSQVGPKAAVPTETQDIANEVGPPSLPGKAQGEGRVARGAHGVDGEGPT